MHKFYIKFMIYNGNTPRADIEQKKRGIKVNATATRSLDVLYNPNGTGISHNTKNEDDRWKIRYSFRLEDIPKALDIVQERLFTDSTNMNEDDTQLYHKVLYRKSQEWYDEFAGGLLKRAINNGLLKGAEELAIESIHNISNLTTISSSFATKEFMPSFKKSLLEKLKAKVVEEIQSITYNPNNQDNDKDIDLSQMITPEDFYSMVTEEIIYHLESSCGNPNFFGKGTAKKRTDALHNSFVDSNHNNSKKSAILPSFHRSNVKSGINLNQLYLNNLSTAYIDVLKDYSETMTATEFSNIIQAGAALHNIGGKVSESEHRRRINPTKFSASGWTNNYPKTTKKISTKLNPLIQKYQVKIESRAEYAGDGWLTLIKAIWSKNIMNAEKTKEDRITEIKEDLSTMRNIFFSSNPKRGGGKCFQSGY